MSVLTFNCYGLKSSINYVADMMKSLDIAFLCEHWLLESEIVRVCDEVFNQYSVYMKSSMTSEDLTTAGRPFGGVGFVCRQKAGFRYDLVKCESDRLLGLNVSYNGCKVLTVYGVCMPYNSGAASQTQLYIDTLNQLSVMIEESSGQTPYLVMGDMDTELSMKVTLHKNWYKQKPFNRHSVLLYDFLCDNELVMCNTKESPDHFTYHKEPHSSYIDFMFINSYAHDKVIHCDVLHHDNMNNSDHLGVRCELYVDCPDTPAAKIKCPKSQRISLNNAEYRTTYLQSLQSALASIPVIDPSRVKVNNAHAVINSQCTQLKDAMHQAASAGLSRATTDRRRRVHWWSRDCTLNRDRTRLYFTSGNVWAGPRAGKHTSATRTLDETTKRRVVMRAMQLYGEATRTRAGFSNAIKAVTSGA